MKPILVNEEFSYANTVYENVEVFATTPGVVQITGDTIKGLAAGSTTILVRDIATNVIIDEFIFFVNGNAEELGARFGVGPEAARRAKGLLTKNNEE